MATVDLSRWAEWWRGVTRCGLGLSLPAGAAAFLLFLASPVEAQPLFRSPVRIALAPNGNLIVSDYREGAIFTLDRRNLEVVRAFTVPGRPLAVAWERGRLFVGNEATGSVEVYNRAGKWLYDLGGAKGIIRQPADIAIDARRGLAFVVDGYDRIVKVFDTRGPLLYTISGPGTAPDQLARPTGIALDQDREEVLVSDYGDPEAGIPARAQIYDYTGDYLGAISGEAGAGEFRFSRPQGLAVDGIGHIFLVDSLLGQVLVFDRATGAGLKTLGSFGMAPGQLLLPLDITLDRRAMDLFVTNNRTGRVEVFRGGGTIP